MRAFARATRCVLVVTQPDRPAGRGQRLQPTPVKRAALDVGIPVLEPERLRDALAELETLGADVYAVASYGKIVPQAVLDLPRLGALNVHPSLLPLYRGATPLQSQLRDGVRQSGVTIIAMDAGMDTGDIVAQESSPIGERETYGELHDRFAALGAALLRQAVDDAFGRTLARTPQRGLASDDAIAMTLTRPLRKEDLIVDWSWSARRTIDLVRSLAPQPGARAHLDGEPGLVKILELRPGEPASGELAVRCGDGTYAIVERLVPPNRKPMSGTAYLAASRRGAVSPG